MVFRLQSHRQLTLLMSLFLLGTFAMIPNTAQANLKFFYDPDTGNVAIDTAEATDGKLQYYLLKIDHRKTSIRFNDQNHIRLTNSTLYESHNHVLHEVTFSSPLDGFYTIGDVLPTGLPQETWLGLFTKNFITNEVRGPEDAPIIGTYGTIDVIGKSSSAAEFIYGMPDKPFNNRIDLIDPHSITWAKSAKLIYRKQTGEVLIDTTGENSGSISSYLLNSDGAFLTENYTPVLDITLSQADSNTIGLFADLIDPGKYSLGNILEPGMDLIELQATFNQAQFFADAGNNDTVQVESDALSLQLVIQNIPEPTSLMLLLSVALVLSVSRDKKISSC